MARAGFSSAACARLVRMGKASIRFGRLERSAPLSSNASVCSAPFNGAACGQCADGYADYPTCAAVADAGAGDIDSGLTTVDAGSSGFDAGVSVRDGGTPENDGGSKTAHAASGCGCSGLTDMPVLNAFVPALLALGVRRRRYAAP